MFDVRTEKDKERLRQAAVLLERENAKLHKQLQKLSKENAELKGLDEAGAQKELQGLVARLGESHGGHSPSHNASERRRRRRRAKRPPKPRTEFGPKQQPRVETQEELFELAVAERCCDECGLPLETMEGAFEESEYIDVVERTFKVRRIKRQKYRKTCACEHGIVTAAGPREPQTLGGRYSLSFIVALALAKYLDHMPLRRQERSFRRSGLEVTAQSMFSSLWLLSHRLSATYSALQHEVLSTPVIHIDETGWRALNAKKSVRELWGMVSSRGAFYRVLDNRSHKGALAMLGAYQGWVLSDGLQVYDKAARLSGFRQAGCWSHARRALFQCENDFPETTEVLDWIDELFLIERETRDVHGNDLDARKQARAERSAPIAKKIRAWLLGARPPKGTSLAKAVNYVLGQWAKLEVFVTHPEVPMSNNAAERALRPGVIGRKNYNGTRSRRGEIVTATMYSIIETARIRDIDPAAYLKAIALHDIAHPGEPLTPDDFVEALQK